jgi:hypothetical protein
MIIDQTQTGNSDLGSKFNRSAYSLSAMHAAEAKNFPAYFTGLTKWSRRSSIPWVTEGLFREEQMLCYLRYYMKEINFRREISLSSCLPALPSLNQVH